MTWTWKHAIVLGASAGIGEAIARQLAATGTEVALVARRQETLDAIASDINRTGPGHAMTYAHDVRNVEAIEALFQEITTALGGLDLIVYSAGMLPPIGPQEFPTSVDVTTIDTNFTGAVAWLNQAAGRFARARTGTIIGISSVAGDRGRVGSPVYNASKAALDSYLEAVRNRLARKGVRVLTAKPGLVRTDMIAGIPTPLLVPVVLPNQAARLILDAAAAGRRVAYIPSWWRVIMLVVRAIPAPIFERLNV